MSNGMKILCACEESQAVTKEFRRLGHEAYSCDIIPCSGGHPEWHLQQDVTPLLKRHWDMIIAFPPCTHLAASGAAHFEKKRNDGRQRQGIEFFAQFLAADCERIAIENPIGIIGGDYIPKWYYDALINSKSSDERARIRSKTFPGIARAMAEQWGCAKSGEASNFKQD